MYFPMNDIFIKIAGANTHMLRLTDSLQVRINIQLSGFYGDVDKTTFKKNLNSINFNFCKCDPIYFSDSVKT